MKCPHDDRPDLCPMCEIDRLRARVAELENYQRNASVWMAELIEKNDRYREALEKIAAADYHEDGDVARAALNPITAE